MFHRLFLTTSALMALAATPALAGQPLEIEAASGGAKDTSGSTITGLVSAVYHPTVRYDLSFGIAFKF